MDIKKVLFLDLHPTPKFMPSLFSICFLYLHISLESEHCRYNSGGTIGPCLVVAAFLISSMSSLTLIPQMGLMHSHKSSYISFSKLWLLNSVLKIFEYQALFQSGNASSKNVVPAVR